MDGKSGPLKGGFFLSSIFLFTFIFYFYSLMNFLILLPSFSPLIFNVPVFLSSVQHRRQLSCTDAATLITTHNKKSWEKWVIEKSGNEVFLSSIKHDQRLMCSPKGYLSGCKNRKSWEKWRMIDAGEGYWFLESNQHRGKFLSSDKDGNVLTTGNKRGWEKWAIQRFVHFFYFCVKIYFFFLFFFILLISNSRI